MQNKIKFHNPRTTPSGRKEEKNAVNIGHLVLCSTRKPLGPTDLWSCVPIDVFNFVFSGKMYTGNRINHFTWYAHGYISYQFSVKESVVCVTVWPKTQVCHQLRQVSENILCRENLPPTVEKPQVYQQLSLQISKAKQPGVSTAGPQIRKVAPSLPPAQPN